ncbi:MAG: thioredoxin family protein [Armatimonadota bacterium]
MKSGLGRIIVIVVLLAAIAGVLAVKSRRQDPPAPTEAQARQHATPAPAQTPPAKDNMAQPEKAAVKPISRPLGPEPPVKPRSQKPEQKPAVAQPSTAQPAKAKALPRLLELGADKCIPCKMMQPVLAELRQDYPSTLQVDFIDVWKDSAAGEQYGVQSIPTQIFFDADGKEIFRHVGFYPKDEILAKFKEHGIEL